jgi:hypothetical protein
MARHNGYADLIRESIDSVVGRVIRPVLLAYRMVSRRSVVVSACSSLDGNECAY